MNNELIKINPVIMDIVHGSHYEHSNPFAEEIFLVDILVALTGQSEIIRQIVDTINPGDELEMIRTDGFSICLRHDGKAVGEVPLESGIIIARLMDAGKSMKCRVTTAGTHSHKCYKRPFSRILAKIYMID